MSENKETVNIFLHNQEVRDNVLSGTSPHEKYIILMNDTLQTENRKLVVLVKEFEDRVEEMDSDLGQAETRNNNIKGLLKNFHEMDKWRDELNKLEEKMLVDTQKSIRAFKWKATKHLRILEGLLVLFAGICFECYPLLQFLPILGILLVVVAFQESTLRNLVLPTFEKDKTRVDELRKDITKTIKAQDYIHEFLDQQ
jgi:hypothetical protein